MLSLKDKLMIQELCANSQLTIADVIFCVQGLGLVLFLNLQCEEAFRHDELTTSFKTRCCLDCARQLGKDALMAKNVAANKGNDFFHPSNFYSNHMQNMPS